VLVTSQAAEKIYRALTAPAIVRTRLEASGTSKLSWLPQETILFNRARICREIEVDVSARAELLALEWIVLGRAAHGEEIADGFIVDGWQVKKDGRLIWADTFRVSDEAFAQLNRKALLADCKAIGTLVYFGPRLDAQLEFLRRIATSLGCRCAATTVRGLIIVRLAARIASDLRRALCRLLEQFGRELGGGPFGLPKMWSC
jgi:urease accessory protein